MIRVVLVGDTQDPLFTSVTDIVRQAPDVRIVARHVTIQHALEDADAVIDTADLTIVVQTWSGQYLSADVNQLIGRTLQARLICLLGPWCESEGRNHTVWPDAFRRPAWMATSVLNSQLQAIRLNQPAIPATASRDEVFADLCQTAFGDDSERSPFSEFVLLVSPDAALGESFCRILSAKNIRSTHHHLLHSPAAHAAQTDELPPHREDTLPPEGHVTLVLHDLDPWCDQVRQSVIAAIRQYPSVQHVGLASLVDSSDAAAWNQVGLSHVIPKLAFCQDVDSYLNSSSAA
jgi:hypothetical protein